MEKPIDYTQYFNIDDTKKKCPYDLNEESTQIDAVSWYKRQSRIAFDLMTKEEQEQFLKKVAYHDDSFKI